jgi:conjugative transposon TraJ protein
MNTTYIQLQEMIAKLYNDMLPTAFQMTAVGQGLAGIAALMYIFFRIWPVLAGREPLDLFPLLRPFAFMLLLLFYQPFIFVLGEVLQPIGNATGKLYADQYKTLLTLIDTKKKILDNQNKPNSASASRLDDKEKAGWLRYVQDMLGTISDAIPDIDPIPVIIDKIIANILNTLFFAVSLIISVLRAFFLVILVTVGPLSIGFSVFPAFANSFNGWLARYIQIWLWAPIASVLGTLLARIQVLMEKADIDAANSGIYIDATDLGHLTFLIIGIVCYLYVPTIASWVIESTGVGRALGQFNAAGAKLPSVAGAVAGRISGGASSLYNRTVETFKEGYNKKNT